MFILYTYLQLPRWSCLQTSLLILQTLRPCDQLRGLVQLCATHREWFGIRGWTFESEVFHISYLSSYHEYIKYLYVTNYQIFYSSALIRIPIQHPALYLSFIWELHSTLWHLGSLATWVRHSCWNPRDRKPMVNSRRLKPRTLLGKWVTSEAACLDASAQNWRSCLILVEEILCMRNSIQPH